MCGHRGTKVSGGRVVVVVVVVGATVVVVVVVAGATVVDTGTDGADDDSA